MVQPAGVVPFSATRWQVPGVGADGHGGPQASPGVLLVTVSTRQVVQPVGV